MPDVKVYIRAENLNKWNSMENKSKWINTLLKNSSDTSNYGKNIQTPVGEFTTVLSEEVVRPPVPKIAGVFPASQLRNTTKLCKVHQTPLDSRGKCLQKGCKYA